MIDTLPDIKLARTLGQDYQVVPVWHEFPSQGQTPIQVFRILKTLSRQCFILESGQNNEACQNNESNEADAGGRNRYTFLGYDPKLEITCADGQLRIRNGTEIILPTDNPGARISRILAENRSPRFAELPPFTGGLAGYFSYDYIKYAEPELRLEPENASAAADEGFKDVDLMLFDKLIVFDRLRESIILIINIRTDALAENYSRAASELSYLRHLLENGTPAPIPPLRILSEFQPLFDEAAYCAMVEKAQRYIFEGDIFQVVLSNRLTAEVEGSLFDTYRVLRQDNPSPYMFYFSSDDIEIAGAAPETLVKLTGRELQTFPLAGTRPRGQDSAEDQRLEAELLADEKELAEHNMLVDLGRNDIGKIAAFGSVKVDKYMSIERFSHVMHIGSTVTGQIRPELDALDAISAILPAGTLSGAPKLRACAIINELENSKRGIYGGAIGYLSFSGDMDVCIAIRIVFKKNGRVFVRSGAGIVADSVPRNEFNECVNKMKATVKALQKAEGGLVDDSSYR